MLYTVEPGRLSGCKGRGMSRRPPEGWSPFFNRRSWRLPWPALASLLCGDRAPAARVPAARPGWRRSWQIELRLRLTAGAACWAREMELPPQVIIATRHHHRHKSSSFLCGGYRVALETFGLRWYLCHFYLHPWWRYLNTFLALTLTTLYSNMTVTSFLPNPLVAPYSLFIIHYLTLSAHLIFWFFCDFFCK